MSTESTVTESAADQFRLALQDAYDEAAAVATEKARLIGQAQLAAQALDEARRIAEAAQLAAEAIESDEAAAAQTIKLARRSILPPAVSRDSARKIATDLVAAFDQFASLGGDATQKDVEFLNDAIADSRAATLTGEIAPDARTIILAVEGVTIAAQEWNSFRARDTSEKTARQHRRELGADTETRSERCPADSRVVQKVLKELRNVLDGVQQPNLETIGELLRQGVSLNQVCQMLGFVDFDGAADIGTLAMLIDRALANVGHYRDASGVTHLSRLGAMNMQDAWKIRTASLPRMRELQFVQHEAGERDFEDPHDTDETHAHPAFGRAVKSYSDAHREKMEANRRRVQRFSEDVASEFV